MIQNKRLLLQITLILFLGCTIVAVHFAFIHEGYKDNVVFSEEGSDKQTEASSALQDKDTGTVVPLVDMNKAKDLFDKGETRFVDVRPEEKFKRGHIPGAVNLPVSAFENAWPDAIDELIPEIAVLIYRDKEDCESPRFVAKQLVRIGFQDIMIMEDKEFSRWETSKYPLISIDKE